MWVQHLPLCELMHVFAVSKFITFVNFAVSALTCYLNTASIVATSFVYFTLDYCNSLYYNLRNFQIDLLQHPKLAHAVLACLACNNVVTCEIKIFQNYVSFRRRPSEIILFQPVKMCLKLFQHYFTSYFPTCSLSLK